METIILMFAMYFHGGIERHVSRETPAPFCCVVAQIPPRRTGY